MSWMDSWSRPKKSSAVPPPLYLTSGDDVPYCKTCGRVMNSKTNTKKETNIIKYCSDRCRNRKPSAFDRKIEAKITALLNGEEDSGIEKTAALSRVSKGEKRLIVTMDEIEEVVFGNRHDPSKTFGRRKNRATRVIGAGKEGEEWKSVDMESSEGTDNDEAEPAVNRSAYVERLEELEPASDGAEGQKGYVKPLVRPAQTEAEVNGSIGGEKGRAERSHETTDALSKRHEGDKRAEEREMVRRAARRGIVFGFVVGSEKPAQERASLERTSDGEPTSTSKKSRHKAKKSVDSQPEVQSTEPPRRKCEAIMQGQVVEPSFAKGDWGIRWRES